MYLNIARPRNTVTVKNWKLKAIFYSSMSVRASEIFGSPFLFVINFVGI